MNEYCIWYFLVYTTKILNNELHRISEMVFILLECLLRLYFHSDAVKMIAFEKQIATTITTTTNFAHRHGECDGMANDLLTM